MKLSKRFGQFKIEALGTWGFKDSERESIVWLRKEDVEKALKKMENEYKKI